MSQQSLNRVTTLLFIVLFAELTFGGGGRLTALGPVSLRMVLFALAILVSVIRLFQGDKISSEYKKLLLVFFVVSTIGLVVGINNGASRTYWWEDIKPLLYFLILPFFEFAVVSNAVIHKASTTIKISAVLQAFIFLLLLFAIHMGIIPFLDFYNLVIQTEEFFFRGEITFFYKGFLYVCIGFIFIHLTQPKNKIAILMCLGLAILLTFTRGFLLALALTYAVYYFPKLAKVKAVSFAALAICILLFGQTVIGYLSQVIAPMRNVPVEARFQILGDRESSDSGRIEQIKEVVDRVTITSLCIGHGFGNGVPSRPIHMEISYLEIFHKQGIIGLAFWGYILWLLYQKYRTGSPSSLKDAFFYSSLFVFFQSVTNQYINNPIGLSIILLTLISLDRLKEEKLYFHRSIVNGK